jgi:hypothetical protein
MIDTREISPELVMVDPELARRARSLLPEPGSFARPAEPAADVGEAPIATEVRLASKPRRRYPGPLLYLALASVALNVVLVRNLASSVPRPSLGAAASDPASDVGTPTRPIAVLAVASRSRAAARADRPPARPSMPKGEVRRVVSGERRQTRRLERTLRWKRQRGASYYDLVLWRGGRRVLDLWPRHAEAHLRGRVGSAVHEELQPGRYLWFVYPGYGPRASHTYGALIASGAVVVSD